MYDPDYIENTPSPKRERYLPTLILGLIIAVVGFVVLHWVLQ